MAPPQADFRQRNSADPVAEAGPSYRGVVVQGVRAGGGEGPPHEEEAGQEDDQSTVPACGPGGTGLLSRRPRSGQGERAGPEGHGRARTGQVLAPTAREDEPRGGPVPAQGHRTDPERPRACQKEEGQMFPQLKEALKPAQLRELGRRLEEGKKAIQRPKDYLRMG